MSDARSFGRTLLLTVALVGAWIPAAVIASPGSGPTAAAPEAPAEMHPVSDEAPHASVLGTLRTA